MTSDNSNPLVSFCLMCYNQEQFVGQAFRAALSQDYSPMEIIVSDDCSTDSSFSIIQSIAEEYKGSHKIILHKNTKNKGIYLNWMQLCELASGDLLFKADGDDISYPERVSSVVCDWNESGRSWVLLAHSYEKIDLQNNLLGYVKYPKTANDPREPENIYCSTDYSIIGASSVYHKSLYKMFRKDGNTRAADDAVFVGRAIMIGTCRLMDKVLVKYRIGSGATTLGKTYRPQMLKGILFHAATNEQNLSDLEYIKDKLSDKQYKMFCDIFSCRLQHHQAVLKLYQGKSLKERLYGYKKVYKGRILSKSWIISAILLLPQSVGDFLLYILLKFRK